MWRSWIITVKRLAVKRLPPIHPGEVLLEDFMRPLGLSQYRVARDIGVPALRISQIVRGRRSITADTALRLARYFGTSAAVWLRLQARYDLEVAEAKMTSRINREVKAFRRKPAGSAGSGCRAAARRPQSAGVPR
jgi:addiction module HigA family antidote